MKPLFSNAWLLHLLWVPLTVGASLVVFYLVSQNRWRRLASPTLFRQLASPLPAVRFYFPAVLVTLALLLIVLALSRPKWGERELPFRESGRSLMVVLDVSRSMLAEDVRPNRLERAKADIHDLAEMFAKDRVGLIVFRGSAQQLCPLTQDLGFFKHALNGVGIHSATPGPTHIGDAIHLALQSLEDALDVGAIVLYSDGEDLIEGAEQAAATAREHGIPIFTVGIGSTDGAPIPLEDGGFLRFDDETVITRMDPATLRRLAEITGGVMLRVGEGSTIRGDTLGRLVHDHLDALSGRQQRILWEVRHVERHPWFLIPATILLLLSALLSRGRPRIQGAVLSFLVVLGVAGSAMSTPESAHPEHSPPAADSRSPAVAGAAWRREAEQRFQRGDYAGAAPAFLKAADAFEGRRAETARFNAALSLYRAGQPETAEALLSPLGESRHLALAATRLHGRILVDLSSEPDADRVERLTQAAEAFQRALRMAPDDETLHGMLGTVLSQLDEARQEAHIRRVMDEHGETPPDTLLTRMLEHQHSIETSLPTTPGPDDAERFIRAYADAAEKQQQAGDYWIPLKQHLLQHPHLATNLVAQATLERQIESLRDAMRTNADGLADIHGESVQETRAIRNHLLPLWQGIAPPPALVDIAILTQSNARVQTAHPDALESQSISRSLTGLFQERFPDWAQAFNHQTTPGEDAASLLPETMLRIEELTEEVLELQDQILNPVSPLTEALPLQQTALDRLHQIRDLLPRPPPQQSPESTDPPHDDTDPPQPDDASEAEPQPGDPPDPSAADATPDRAEPVNDDESPSPDIERLLERAERREREHAEEERRRARRRPPPAGVRDW